MILELECMILELEGMKLDILCFVAFLLLIVMIIVSIFRHFVIIREEEQRRLDARTEEQIWDDERINSLRNLSWTAYPSVGPQEYYYFP